MRRGDHAGVQRMFRARVAAQGFTVAAMVAGGIYYGAERRQERELWKVQRETDAEEKRQRWIRELEARDAEDKAMLERLDRRRKKAAEKGAGDSGDAATPAGAAGGVSEAVSAAVTRSKAKSRGGDEDAAAEKLGAEEKKGGSGVLGSWGGLFGRSGATPDDPKPEAGKSNDDTAARK